MKRQCKLTVRRPGGEIEIVDYDLGIAPDIHPAHWAKMIEATRKAGRGELLSYEIIEADRERAELRRKERDYDNLHNEGGDGYNPYRGDDVDAEYRDATPYHKGDDLSD